MRNALVAFTLTIAALISAPVIAQQQATPGDPEENAEPMPAATWLFVQTASSMTFEGNTLTLKGVAPQTLMFADRPERMTGDASTGKFVSFWTSGKNDFEKDPPNATLSVTVDGKPQLSVVELTNPQLKGDTLTYTVKLLDGTPPAVGQPATLFIDWWYGPGWGPRHYWHPGPWGPYGGGRCWRGPYGGLHCRPAWAY
ncbi:hypothetical protein [Pseudomonas sp. NPDC086278]|uniref:hypothetical protein n=1 Tax=Pseudomonas sp. NPDC086278 TaxID=3390646 RepID=UPI003CFE21B0